MCVGRGLTNAHKADGLLVCAVFSHAMERCRAAQRWLLKEEANTYLVHTRVVVFGLVCYMVQKALIGDDWGFLTGGSELESDFYKSFYVPRYYYLQWLPPLPRPGTMVCLHVALLVAGACVLVGMFTRLAMTAVAGLVVFFFISTEHTYLNHQYLLCWVFSILVCLPLADSWSVDAWLWPRLFGWKKVDDYGRQWYNAKPVPRWMRASLQLLLVAVYFYGAVAKLNQDWLRSQPLQAWLTRPRNPWLLTVGLFGVFNVRETVLAKWWFAYLLSYGGILWDFAAPVLIHAPGRLSLVGLICMLIFHGTNYVLFNIGLFPWACVSFTVLHSYTAQLCTVNKPNRARRSKRSRSTYRTKRKHTAAMVIVGVACVIFVAIPLKGVLNGGDVLYAEDGHMFTWRMFMRNRSGDVKIDIDMGQFVWNDFMPATAPLVNVDHKLYFLNNGTVDSPLCLTTMENEATKNASLPCRFTDVSGGQPIIGWRVWKTISMRPNSLARFTEFLKRVIDEYHCPIHFGYRCDSRIYVRVSASTNYGRTMPFIGAGVDLADPDTAKRPTIDWLEPEPAREGFERFQYPWVFLLAEDNPCMPWHNVHRSPRQRALCAYWWYMRGGREWWNRSEMENTGTCSLPDVDDCGLWCTVRHALARSSFASRGWWWEWFHSGFNDDELISDQNLAAYWMNRARVVDDSLSDLGLELDLDLHRVSTNPTVGRRRKDD